MSNSSSVCCATKNKKKKKNQTKIPCIKRRGVKKTVVTFQPAVFNYILRWASTIGLVFTEKETVCSVLFSSYQHGRNISVIPLTFYLL